MEFQVIERKEIVNETLKDDYLENRYIVRLIQRMGLREYLKIIADNPKQARTVQRSLLVSFQRKKIEIKTELTGRVIYVKRME